MSVLQASSWPAARLGEAIEVLARRSGLSPRAATPPAPPPGIAEAEALGAWIESAARWVGVEAERAQASYATVEALVRSAAPAILRIKAGFLALLDGGRSSVALLGPDLEVRRARVEEVRAGLCAAHEAPHAGWVDTILASAGVREPAPARRAILREFLVSARVDECWMLRLAPGAPFGRHVRQAGLLGRGVALLSAHLVSYALMILSWIVIGRGALEGRLEPAWLLAWALLLATGVPFRMLATWMQGKLSIGLGGILKQRLLAGALRLDPEEVRHQGVGHLLGRVIESAAIESLALGSGFAAFFALFDLAFAACILWLGPGGGFSVLLLVAWAGLMALLGWRAFRARLRWTESRLGLTYQLVEKMVGHRTRAAQEARERWHEGEDGDLERYLAASRSMDRRMAALSALMPRGWMLAGLAGLALAFAAGATGAGMAIGLGGILLGWGALSRLAAGLQTAADAAIAWRQVAPVFRAAARPAAPGSPLFAIPPEPVEKARPVLEAREVVFRYPDRAEPVLRGCDFAVASGERVLLEGRSGSGKSTLASILAGIRAPDSGLLLLRGLDRPTLGAEGWRRRVAAVPQFHENYVFTETLAFNLLMGRRWPPGPGDFEEAGAVCRALGLGELLDRMPAGLVQTVGEAGWQLSHGERSRLFIARALLQGAELVVIDEGFGALDPENLFRTLRAVVERCPTVLAIGHA